MIDVVPQDPMTGRMPAHDRHAEHVIKYGSSASRATTQLPALAARGGGAIVVMSSTAALAAKAGLAGYAAANAGALALTRTAALDYAAAGIRVHALGPILTDRLAAAGEQAHKQVAATVPLGRPGHPHEVAAAAAWLCSEEASFITGTTLTIDGGRLAGAP